MAQSVGRLIGEQVLVPFGKAAGLSFAGGVFAWVLSSDPQIGSIWAAAAGLTYLVKHWVVDETVEQVKAPKQKPEPALQPWEVTTHHARTELVVTHTDPDSGYGRGTFYITPIAEIKFRRVAFHVWYMGGHFSHRYLTSPERKPRILTKTELTTLQHYLINRGAARWKAEDRRGGVLLLEDGWDMFDYMAKRYIPSPFERKLLAKIARCRVVHTTLSHDTVTQRD